MDTTSALVRRVLVAYSGPAGARTGASNGAGDGLHVGRDRLGALHRPPPSRADADDAVAVLEQLEAVRERLAGRFDALGSDVAVVLHGSDAQLLLARPELAARRALTTPSSRRYLVGAVTGSEIHVLAPRRLAERAGTVADLRAMLDRAPRRALRPARHHEHEPGTAPDRPRAALGVAPGRLGGLVLRPERARPAGDRPPPARGAGAVVPADRPRRRAARRDGRRPARPSRRASVRPSPSPVGLHPTGPRQALVSAFAGRPLAHTEGTWRAHLAKLAAPRGEPAP